MHDVVFCFANFAASTTESTNNAVRKDQAQGPRRFPGSSFHVHQSEFATAMLTILISY